MATLVSTVSGATRLSLEITALFWESVFDTVSESTSGGRWLGSAAWNEAKAAALAVGSVFAPLSPLNPRIVSSLVSSSTAAGYSLVNRSLAATESLVEGGFALSAKAVNMGLHAAGEYVRFIDAVFGSTDTSRVLASFVHMVRRETLDNNPEIRALIKEHGLVSFVSQLLKTVVAWMCLQVVTHGRDRPYRMDLIYTNIRSDAAAFCPRRFVTATGAPLPARTPQPARSPAPRSPAATPRHASPMIFHADRLRAGLHSAGLADTHSPTPGPARRRSATLDIPPSHAAGPAAMGLDSSSSSSDSDGAMYVLSDQEGLHGDGGHGWDKRLVDALGSSSAHDGHRAPAGNGYISSDSDDSLVETAPPRNRSSIWTALHTVREAAAAVAKGQGTRGCADSSGEEQSPAALSAMPRNSAPASLVSSPQFPTTPNADADAAGTVHRSNTIMADASLHGMFLAFSPPPPSPRPPPFVANGEVPQFGALPPAITPIVDISIWPAEPAHLKQEFPHRPLLFNLARFISIASSSYGQRFMQVIGMDSGMIDARALIEAYGDCDPYDYAAPAGGLSRTASASSMDLADTAAGLPLRPGVNPGLAMPPLAQSAASRHTPLASCSPPARRQAKALRPETPGGRRTPGRRPHPRHAHVHRRPVQEHPNHFCFSQHSGIPLSDLLFSSYVSPIVPGVTKAASVRASAVERRLRHRRSAGAFAGPASNPPPQGPGAADDEPRSGASAGAPADAPAARRCWLSAVPVVGSLYQRLPSPVAAISYVPAIPGIISRTLGFGGAASAASRAADAMPADGPAKQADKHRSEDSAPKAPREPTLGQFRRFDKIRRRLVYRNPSIHALVHYIAVDHATRSVVLACRGTLGISDLFIDMLCEYEAVRLPGHAAAIGGNAELRAHSGMWHSALLLADPTSEVFKEVAEALRLYPEYGLVITGHSLGGGVASLLTLLWSQPLFSASEASDAPPGPARALPGSLAGSARRFVTTDKFGLVTRRPIHCFSYGSPCSTNAALSGYCRGLVTSVVNTDDFVSFMSVGAFVDILNISAILGRERGVAERVMRGFLSAQRSKVSKKFRLFDFDFSKLRAYDPDPDLDPGSDGDGDGDDSRSSTSGAEGGAGRSERGRWWDFKTSQSNAGASSSSGDSSPSPCPSDSSPRPNRADKARGRQGKKGSLDDWYLSLVKTLRASMDSEKLYPPGDVFILASPGDDEVADKHLPLA
ncbi:hypothetical protein LPJ61_002349, partial [Coemansia biformis]